MLPYPWAPSPNPQGNTYEEQYKADCDEADTRYREFISKPQYSGQYDDRTQYHAEKARLAGDLVTWCDLAAQHFAASGATSAAKSSWWTFGTAAVGVVLLVWTLWEANRVTHITRRGIADQNRPWVSVKPVLIQKPRFEDGNVGMGISLHAKNHGNWPAIEVHKHVRLLEEGANLHSGLIEFKKHCNRSTPSPETGRVVFPGETHKDVMHIVSGKAVDRRNALPIVFGVTYTFYDGERKFVAAGMYLSRESLDPNANWTFVDMGWEFGN